MCRATDHIWFPQARLHRKAKALSFPPRIKPIVSRNGIGWLLIHYMVPPLSAFPITGTLAFITCLISANFHEIENI